MFSKRINELTEFSHGLIYHFVAEGENPDRTSTTPWQDYYIPNFLQFNDVLNTYIHLQNDILPKLKSKGLRNITSDEWVCILKDIHRHISQQLGKTQGFKPGALRNRSLVIAKDDIDSLNAIFSFVAGYIKISKEDFCKSMAQNYHRSSNDFADFINLLVKMSRETHIELVPSQIEFLSHVPKKDYSALFMREHLTTAYLNEELTEKEKNTVDKLMRPCPHSEQLERLISEFASELHQRLRILNLEDDAEIATFLAYSFWQITTIHPFSNANGRTATCFINLLLIAIGKTNVCLYRGLEKNDMNSEYFKSIAQIEDSRVPLQQLILKRMHEDIIIEDQEKDITNIYVDFCQFLCKKKEQAPHLSIDQIYNIEVRRIVPRTQEHTLSPQETLVLFKSILRGAYPSEIPSHSIFAISKKQSIETALKKLTPENSKWTYYEKANTALLECVSVEDARNIRNNLQEKYGLDCTMSRIAATGINVVQLKNIKLQNLNAITTKDIATHPSI